jgi:malate synthase
LINQTVADVVQAAQIPIKDDAAANEAALELVRKDKLREVRAGHDGTWAAHPGLIPAIREVFEGHLGGRPNQIDAAAGDAARAGVAVTEEDLLQPPRGARTVEGLRHNTRVGVQYVAAWLSGSGSVPLYNLMEDAATAEISRVQNWQWRRSWTTSSRSTRTTSSWCTTPEHRRRASSESLSTCIPHRCSYI